MRRELKFALCAVVLVCSGITGYLSIPKTQDSNMLMENVEALAHDENPNNCWEGKDEITYPVYMKIYDSQKQEYVDSIIGYRKCIDCFGYKKGCVECYPRDFPC
ncbi:NVEALA domain-containing protein [Xylanibacter muris]|uniref:Uncharacterized protein n=1 Tax=Xylanibacter muris TaxID=2736290 RepID=A0ABX2ANM1_9BACT|nr:NVEALA domain-containing protein [Xylanibacter muris]NPD91627.1 hypothetical protein [Xylanibacter muris]